MSTYENIMCKTPASLETLLIMVLLFSYTSIADALQNGSTVLESKLHYTDSLKKLRLYLAGGWIKDLSIGKDIFYENQ